MHLLVPFFVSLRLSVILDFSGWLVLFLYDFLYLFWWGRGSFTNRSYTWHSVHCLVSSCLFKSLFPRTPQACLPLPSAGLWAASVGANLSSTGTIMATPLWVWCMAPATVSFCWPSGESLEGGCGHLPQTAVGRRASVKAQWSQFFVCSVG